ncbi:MAG: hydroxyacid dehydrogenase [Christensenellales bacterium]|jgi:phosphoglycerate dehydrogenase-like enzyme
MIAVFASMSPSKNKDGKGAIERAYDDETRKELREKLKFVDNISSMDDIFSRKEEMSNVSVIFSTWGMPALSSQEIDEYFPRLKAVFYAAGSVQRFARPFLEKGVNVFSAADANAIPVIEYTVAQIILAGKGFYQSARIYGSQGDHGRAKEYFSNLPGNYGISVGIIGAGKIGGGVLEKLMDYDIKTKVYDPYLPPEKAKALGAQQCSLEELFESCFIVSNHMANNEHTQRMLRYEHFSRMDDYGVFINTGRGAQVCEEGLARAMSEKPGRTALLDVTFPEPVQAESPFFQLENVILTPHIAGSAGNEVARMGRFMARECEAFLEGKPLKYEVTLKMLETMA